MVEQSAKTQTQQQNQDEEWSTQGVGPRRQRRQQNNKNNSTNSNDGSSSSWRQHSRGGRGKGQGRQGRGGGFKSSFGSSQWSRPRGAPPTSSLDKNDSTRKNEKTNGTTQTTQTNDSRGGQTYLNIEQEQQVTESLGQIVSSQIENCNDNEELEWNAAIASTAAVMTVLSALSSPPPDGDDVDSDADGTNEDSNAQIAQEKVEKVTSDKSTNDSNTDTQDFSSKMQNNNLSQLLQDYGEKDESFRVTKQAKPQNSKPQTTKHHHHKHNQKSNGALAPQGEAPIHVTFVSFGYHYGAPPHDDMIHIHLPPPLDCRKWIDPVPPYMQKWSGVNSSQVKRAVLNSGRVIPSPKTHETNDSENDNEEEETTPALAKINIRDKINTFAQSIYQTLATAVVDGHAGHASPFHISVYIGSEFGKHRSVVLVEMAAVALRAFLRKTKFHNDCANANAQGNVQEEKETDEFVVHPALVGQKVSVATRHRDAERSSASMMTAVEAKQKDHGNKGKKGKWGVQNKANEDGWDEEW